MIAVTIFGIISISVFSTFRAGLKSYEAGREQMIITQSARITLDLLTRDLRALYYQAPETYNRNIITQLQIRWTMRLQNLQQFTLRPDTQEPPLTGVPIDLTILGKPSEGGGDALTFAIYQMNWGTTPIEPWALARVKYIVDNGNLYRSEGPITVETVPGFQWQEPAPPPELGFAPAAPPPPPTNDIGQYLKDAPRELIARGVKTFDLRYGYWTGEGWFETEEWAAHERLHRNPPYVFDPNDPNAANWMQRNLNRPTDGIPAWVQVTLALTYGKDNSRVQVFKSRIRLMNAMETYEPVPEFSLMPGAGNMPR